MSAIKPKANREVTSELDRPLPDIELRCDIKTDPSSTILSEPFPAEIIKRSDPPATIEPEPEVEKEVDPTNLNIITFNDVSANFDTSQMIQPREADSKDKNIHFGASKEYVRQSLSSLPNENCTIFDVFTEIVKEVKTKGFFVVFRNDRLIEEEATQTAAIIIYLVLGAIALILFIVGYLIFSFFR